MDFSYIKNYLKGRDLVLYGMGVVGKECSDALELSGIPIAAYTASHINVPPKTNEFNRKTVISPDTLHPDKHYVLIAVSREWDAEIVPIVREKGFKLTEDYTLPFFANYPPVDYLYNGIPVGKHTTIPETFGDFIKERNSEVASIGRFCSLNKTMRVGGDHPQLLSTSAYLYDTIMCDIYRNSSEITCRKVVIGNDVWIGTNAFINSSKVRYIGDGAIIGAGAVVTHDVPPYAIMAGVPAKVIKYRFTPEQIDILLQVKWWDQSDEWLYQNRDLFFDTKSFFAHINAGL